MWLYEKFRNSRFPWLFNHTSVRRIDEIHYRVFGITVYKERVV